MSFAPPRKQRTGATVAASPFSRRQSGSRAGSPSAASPRRRATSTYHAPPPEAVKEQMRRYAQSIRRRQPPPDGYPVPKPHLPRGGAKRGAGTAPARRPGGLLLSRSRGKVAERNGDLQSPSSREVGEPRQDASRVQGRNVAMEARRLPSSVNYTVSPKHGFFCSDANASSQQLLLQSCHGPPGASLRTGDDASDEYVGNPYIRSVLRGAEQRWVPSSSVHAPFSHHGRSQGLDWRHTEQSPSPSRRELVGEWKKITSRSSSNETSQVCVDHTGKSGGDTFAEVEQEVRRPHSVNSPGGESAADPAQLHSTHAQASEPQFSLAAEGGGEGRAGGSHAAWRRHMRYPERNQGVQEVAEDLPRRGAEATARRTKVADTGKVNLTFLYSDVEEDPRAYLYAPLTDVVTPFAGKAHRCSSPLELGAASRPAVLHKDGSAAGPHHVGDAKKAQAEGLTPKFAARLLGAAPGSFVPLQQGMTSAREQASFGACPCRSWNGGATNYLVAPETEIVDASGAVWLATLSPLKK
ncbi:uncharacterized protein Tco025E_07527 [Trypanosoma conorhini]|uniref:Uncharacterized protein n=1 Tax=Trypanosoma conorhini TaxID=83891 RepID=A0A3R7MQN3_9TRYP|nr:uncharacterized protein Tco025E_07527 [Trypanosoma conorhini]RNF06660.1 hypothetical protein Tco025E_07527 [Trypanosoma conorhini]